MLCYICGDYTVKEQRKPITNFVKKAYFAYFGIRLGDQDKSWAPHIVCKTCTEILRMWAKGKKKHSKFGIPIIWREPKNHSDDCYFCTVNIKDFNRIRKSTCFYPDLESARRPVLHCDEIPEPEFTHLPDLEINESMMDCPESETLVATVVQVSMKVLLTLKSNLTKWN